MTKYVSVGEEFDATIASGLRLSAYAVIATGGRVVGRIILRRSASGMATTAWVQVWGAAMVKATVRGCGADMQTMAVAKACLALRVVEVHSRDVETRTDIDAWCNALNTRGGQRWVHVLDARGYRVQHVI